MVSKHLLAGDLATPRPEVNPGSNSACNPIPWQALQDIAAKPENTAGMAGNDERGDADAMAATNTAGLPGSSPQGDGASAFEIVLKPVSHAELGDIGIDENLFAVGRTETPFDTYPAEVVADLSRRHARIFCESGIVHIADMGSKNGTTVNGVDVRQKTARLQNGDEIRFGRTLAFRVQLAARTPAPAARLLSLSLRPALVHPELQPIVITQFPFLISKADTAFARYKDSHPQQVNYLSRRHAHIFLKRGLPFVEDLGSTNGTFVGGKRLDEHAVALHEGDTLAFGGHYFVFQVSLQTEEVQLDPTLTQFATVATQGKKEAAAGASMPAPTMLQRTVEVDKTTFIAAADSFLDIFCIDQQPAAEEVNPAAPRQELPAENTAAAARGRPPARSWIVRLTGEIATMVDGADRARLRRRLWWGGSALVLALAAGGALYASGRSEREIRALVASGDYARAASLAADYLTRRPDNAEMRALATESLLKAHLPGWTVQIGRHQFEQAAAQLGIMRETGRSNPDLPPLMAELAWIGNLEQFFSGRETADAPIRIYADEDRIAALLKYWEQDALGHQRNFATIAAQVPPFRETYAVALSHLRRLQSDNAVYLAAIERLKAAMAAELRQDNPEAVAVLLKTYAEKYPRIGGLELVRQDLQHYNLLVAAARSAQLGPLATQLASPGFATPLFQTQLQVLEAGGRLPPADIVQRYAAVSRAWGTGTTSDALTALQAMAAGGPWAAAAASELARKKALADQYAALNQARATAGHADRLLAFFETLSADEDTYFIKAITADSSFDRERARKRALDRFLRASALWQRYQQGGTIDDSERQEATISTQFKTQAMLLADARHQAQQGERLLRVLSLPLPQDTQQLTNDLVAEARQQHEALLAARAALSPPILKEKLALLEGGPLEK